MASFELTHRTRADLALIDDYTLKQWGREQANRYLDGLADYFRELTRNPMLGRERAELRKGLRSVPIESHVVFYLELKDGIAIVRILHKRQDPARHL